MSGSVLFLRGTTWSTLTGADVNAQCDTAMSDYGALQPTTAGRKLDVTAGGNAGIDWANIESPTTTVDLSGTTVAVVTDVFNTVTANMTEIGGSTNAAVGAALMGVGYSDNGKINANVTSMAANVVNANALASDASSEIATAVRDITTTGSAAGGIGDYIVAASTSAAEASGYAQNIINKLGAWAGSGINTVLGAFKALLRSDASAPSNIGGTFDPSTDSAQAIRDALQTVDDNVDAIKAKSDQLFFSGSVGSTRVLADANVTLDEDDVDAIADQINTTGNGDIAINHNYGGTDAMRVLDESTNDPIDDATITALVEGAKVAQTRTGSDGRWVADLMLDAGSYTINVSKANVIEAYSFTLVVTGP